MGLCLRSPAPLPLLADPTVRVLVGGTGLALPCVGQMWLAAAPGALESLTLSLCSQRCSKCGLFFMGCWWC